MVPWASTGWTNNRNVTQMLEFLMMRGEIAIAGRVGRERLWDLAKRVYPADVVVPPIEEAHRIRNERRLTSLGIARQKTTKMPIEPVDVGDVGERAVVEGVKGEWRVDPAEAGLAYCWRRLRGTDCAAVAVRPAHLRPTPRPGAVRVRVHPRDDKPAAKRRWGYFALPVLHDDRLVGKVDATADRKTSVLRAPRDP